MLNCICAVMNHIHCSYATVSICLFHCIYPSIHYCRCTIVYILLSLCLYTLLFHNFVHSSCRLQQTYLLLFIHTYSTDLLIPRHSSSYYISLLYPSQFYNHYLHSQHQKGCVLVQTAEKIISSLLDLQSFIGMCVWLL